MSDAIKHITDAIFFFQEDSALVHMHCACNTVQLLRLSRLLSLKPFLQQPELNALTTRLRESYSSVSMSRESKRLKKSRSDWLSSGNALIQHLSEKNAIFFFSVLPGSAEAHVIWGGIVKRFWLLTLSVTFLPKISKCVHVCQSYSKAKVGHFWDTVYISEEVDLVILMSWMPQQQATVTLVTWLLD